MSIIIGILTVLEVIVCLLLSLVVLAQKPRQDGLGAAFGSGLMDQYAGAHATNVLQKATVYLGVALFALTFLLAILVSRADQHNVAPFVDTSDLNKAKAAAAAAPAAGAQPSPSDVEALKKALLDQSAANKAKETKPAAAPVPAPTPAAQKPADTKSAAPAATPTPAPAPQQKPADATPAPAPVPAPQKPADATPAPASAAPANK